ncbi:GNAT family N-acetyltransferase [Frigidibacter albus]|uniref:GNAT family N-acetyltransferase n=1 Tax=Frigidibacter albus TaxID=1465486 RepID=A0A6L8VGW6_9RHOB|nr:GNAT family N-acetyltransferase [Frigidibacter albus]NBE30997.1 GNAT family N-acetyltransferase [Frigidibacter albus]GGH52296.1 acetyltransferase [Frigidibacter albus]
MQRMFGEPVVDWTAPPRPGPEALEGLWARLERLEPEDHAADLFRANSADDAIWDYLPYGPFASLAGYHRWMREVAGQADPFFYAIRDLETGHLGGVASYLRITPEVGCIEIGHINLAPELQRTRAATEALVLMMDWAFGAGYRRFEWKCDALNIPSRRAAQRLGFSHEGTFRQATIVKGRNRDTAWFAVTDGDWPALAEAFRVWLSPGNFTDAGMQIERLSDLTALVRVSSDPALG